MKIDLLPKELKTKRSPLFNVGLSLKGLLMGFVFFWLLLGIVTLFITRKNNYFKKGLARIEADWKNTEPLLKQREAFLKRKQELDSFLILLKEAFKRDIFWSEKLNALTYIVPKEVWLKEIYFRKEGQEQMVLDIWAAVSYLKSDEGLLDKINNFVEEIKKDSNFFKDFQNLALLEINKAGSSAGAEGNTMDFKLSLSLKQKPVEPK